MTTLKAWTIKQLYDAWQNDLSLCHTDLERSMCNVINRKEIMTLADKLQEQRKLTPVEQAIIESI
jgi:hypothetical protein